MKKLLVMLLFVSVGLLGCGSGNSTGGTTFFQSGSYSKEISPVNSAVTSTILTDGTINTTDTNIITIKNKIEYFANALNKLPFSMNGLTIIYTKTTDPNYTIIDPQQTVISLPADVPYTIATASIKDKIILKGYTPGDEFYVTANFTITEQGNKSEPYTGVYLAKVRFQ